jgi:multidrug transporter EmrE-like cation transporter
MNSLKNNPIQGVVKKYLPLHAIFLLYSLCGVFSKLSAKQDFLSISFIIFYGLSLFILVVYSLLWQIILQKLPLTIAYSNKGVVVIWGILWGFLFFGENFTIIKIVAAILIIAGIAVIGSADE